MLVNWQMSQDLFVITFLDITAAMAQVSCMLVTMNEILVPDC